VAGFYLKSLVHNQEFQVLEDELTRIQVGGFTELPRIQAGG
jgi:hypothetical protein